MDTKQVGEVADKAIDGAQKVAVVVEPVIKQWAKELLEWAKAGKDFVAEQMPLLVQEIIKWGFAEAICWMIVAIALFLIGLYFRGKLRAQEKNSPWRSFDEGGPLPLFAWLGIGGVWFVSFLMFFGNLFTAVKTVVAPRVYLIEYLANIVQNSPK